MRRVAGKRAAAGRGMLAASECVRPVPTGHWTQPAMAALPSLPTLPTPPALTSFAHLNGSFLAAVGTSFRQFCRLSSGLPMPVWGGSSAIFRAFTGSVTLMGASSSGVTPWCSCRAEGKRQQAFAQQEWAMVSALGISHRQEGITQQGRQAGRSAGRQVSKACSQGVDQPPHHRCRPHHRSTAAASSPCTTCVCPHRSHR